MPLVSLLKHLNHNERSNLMSAMQSKHSVVSLFSGAGGFDWGFHKTGRFETLLASEILPRPAATFARNFNCQIIDIKDLVRYEEIPRRTVIEGDICKVDFTHFKLTPDVLIGGPPCQDFSMAISVPGDLRPGLNGGRGKLYIEFVRAAMFFQPKIVVFENVPGLKSANLGLAYKTIKDDLRKLEASRQAALAADPASNRVPQEPVTGYTLIFSDDVEVQRMGVPQTRKRLIIVGVRQDIYDQLSTSGITEPIAKLQRTLKGTNSPFTKFPLTCLEAFEGSTLLELEAKYQEIMAAYSDLADRNDLPIVHKWREDTWDRLTRINIRADYFALNEIEDTLANQNEYAVAMKAHKELLTELGWWGNSVATQDLTNLTMSEVKVSKEVIDRMRMIPPGENHEFVAGTEWNVEGKEISLIYRRPHPLRPAWTVMAHGGGGTYGYHYERERSMLTLRERARIQTFTDDFSFATHGIREQIGEAVPPLLGKRIAEIIDELLVAWSKVNDLKLTQI